MKKLWEEFLVSVEVPGMGIVPMCGLCGNHGRVNNRTTSPAGIQVDLEDRPCICPNGRALKKPAKKPAKPRNTRYWLSWIEPADDYRPLHDPPNKAILGWWCSGSSERNGRNHHTLCALVKAPNEMEAKASVETDWPHEDEVEWRFLTATTHDWRPGDRFPYENKQWMKARIEAKD